MSDIDLVGLTNALTDITVNIQDNDLENLGVEKGSYKGLKNIDPEKLAKILTGRKKSYCQAGSPANVIINAQLLGLNTALFGTVGDDDIGKMYIKNLRKTGIKPFISRFKGKSGICYILVTPDGERTNLPNLGVSREFNFNLNRLKNTRLFHTSGYETVTNPDKTEEAIDYAKHQKAEISFDLADKKMIKQQRKTIEKIVEKTDILFVTEEEAKELTGDSPLKSLKELSKICPIVSLKRSSKGSIVRKKDEQYKVQAYPTKLINTCGAGDAYASGFLFAYLRGFSLEECGKMGSYIASRVCSSEKSNLNTENVEK